MRAGADSFKEDKRGIDSLNYATRYGYVDSVEILVRGRSAADINKVSSVGTTVLMNACVNRRLEVVKLLLRCGADPFIVSDVGAMALHLTSDLTIFKVLLEGHHAEAAAYVDVNGIHSLSLRS